MVLRDGLCRIHPVTPGKRGSPLCHKQVTKKDSKYIYHLAELPVFLNSFSLIFAQKRATASYVIFNMKDSGFTVHVPERSMV
jgi:hypothetical protein